MGITETVSENILLIMGSRSMTVEELSAKSGIRISALRRILAGGDMTVSVLNCIAKSLDVPIANLVAKAS